MIEMLVLAPEANAGHASDRLASEAAAAIGAGEPLDSRGRPAETVVA
jgi:hypothetical protein